MALVRIRQPVEYSFLQWINNHPDSGHWADKERFLRFVKTVCRYNANRWKRSNYLKSRILEVKPHFDPDLLDRLLDLYDDLIQFHKTGACISTQSVINRTSTRGHYIEVRVRNGIIYERELPLT